MSSRPPPATIGKPPVFQKPHKPKPTTKMVKRPPIKKAAANVGSKLDHPRTIRTTEETNLLVKLPSVESDDYKSPTSSSSSESSEDSEHEEGEVDSELDREETRGILSENEDRFSGANSPWFESQDHDETTLSELVQNAQEIDIENPEEVEESEVVKVDIEEIQGKMNSPQPRDSPEQSVEPEEIEADVNEEEVEQPRQPLSMKNGGRMQRSKTPQTMVQLIDDIESSCEEEKEETSEAKEAEITELRQKPSSEDAETTPEETPSFPPKMSAQAEVETQEKQSPEPSVLEKAKAGNEKRMARFLQDGEFYESYPIKNKSSEDQRSLSASTVTLPSPVSAFTPEAHEEYTGGYNDILNVLERLEDETKEDSSEDKDSGRPQSESSSATTSPKRTSSSNTVAAERATPSRASPSKMR